MIAAGQRTNAATAASSSTQCGAAGRQLQRARGQACAAVRGEGPHEARLGNTEHGESREQEGPSAAQQHERGAECSEHCRELSGVSVVHRGCGTGRSLTVIPLCAMIEAWKRVLVLAPHTDDGELGCGGTTARLVEAGIEVHYHAFSIATRSLPDGFAPDTLAREVREATAELGIPESQLTVHDFDVRTFPERRQDILELLVATWDELRPDAVFQPSHHDVHQDHQTIAQEGLRAFKRTTVLGYEIPWNNFDFSYGAYVALEQRHVERKIAALARYASQQHRRYANPEYVWNLARVHGINVNRDYAECFQVYRIVT